MPAVALSPLFNGWQGFTAAGLPLSGGFINTYLAGTSTPLATYTTIAGNVANSQPIQLGPDGRPPFEIWLIQGQSYKLVLTDSLGANALTYDNISGIGDESSLLVILATAVGSTLIGWIQAGIGAVLRTVSNKLRERVSIGDYGGVPGSDCTAPAANAITYLASVGGGVLEFPNVGDYIGNVVVAASNITLRGVGGNAENNLISLRPFDITKPTVTFGDDTNVYRYCGVENMHVIGTDGTSAGVTQILHNAPQALLLKGGVVNFRAYRSVFYNGAQTVAMVPSATQPVTGYVFLSCTLRNDLTDSALARTIYGIRKADPGYFTDIKWIGCKLNAPTLGYLAEFDGTIDGILAEFDNCYADVKPDHGILLKGGSTIAAQNLELDPGTTGVVVFETNQGGDPTRYIVGNVRLGGQKIRTTAGTTDIPVEANTFSYKHRLIEPFLAGPINITPATDPYNTTSAPQLNPISATGPLAITHCGFRIATPGQGLEIAEGTNAKANITTAMVAGSVTIANTSITANTRILATRLDGGANPGAVYVNSRVNGVSFTIKSTSATDTGVVYYELREPV